MLQMEACYTEHSRQLAAHLPALAAHFTRLGLRPDLYLLDWVMTLYSRYCTVLHCGPRGCSRQSQLYEHLFCMFWASN